MGEWNTTDWSSCRAMDRRSSRSPAARSARAKVSRAAARPRSQSESNDSIVARSAGPESGISAAPAARASSRTEPSSSAPNAREPAPFGEKETRRIGELEVASESLFPLDRLEEGLEVPLSEAAASLSLDDLVEDGRTVLDRFGEQLEEVALLVPVDEDSQARERVDVLVDRPDARREHLVVRGRNREERHAAVAKPRHGVDDVRRRERDVLHARAAVEIEVLLDLGFPFSLGPLVDRQLDTSRSVRDHLRHDRCVFGGSVLV